MTHLTLATNVFVLACFCHAFPQVRTFADRCVRIGNILDAFVSALRQAASLQIDEMGHDEVAETVETCEEQMVRLGFVDSDGMIKVEDF